MSAPITNIRRFVYRQRYLIAFLSLGAIYFFNLFIDIMDVDAAQYASIAQEMIQGGSYLEVYHRGTDYLDKPPLLFWLSALSFNIFGFSNWAFKLPAVLILAMGIYATYRFVLLWYDRKRALTAALILASTHALFLMTNDVRTDGLLTGFTAVAIWKISDYLKRGHLWSLIWAGAAVSLGMMSKGPIALIIAGSAVFGQMIMFRRWRWMIDPKWILFFAVIAVMLAPMTYGLYQQFDLHPEKSAYEIESPSGVKFFYWTQSFGRITGASSWDNGQGFDFFFHSILADMLPWSLLLVVVMIYKIRNLFRQKFKGVEGQEYFTLFGFWLPFLALSLSNYKLPHYIFPLFPFAAVMMADFIFRFEDHPKARWLLRFQVAISILIWAAAPISFVYVFENRHPLWLLFVILFPFLVFWWVRGPKEYLNKYLWLTVGTAIYFGVVTSLYFYPNLLEYQPTKRIAEYIKTNDLHDRVYTFGQSRNSLDFYAGRWIPYMVKEDIPNLEADTYVLTDAEGVETIRNLGRALDIIDTYDNYHITKMNGRFLMKSSRPEVLDNRHLVRIK